MIEVIVLALGATLTAFDEIPAMGPSPVVHGDEHIIMYVTVRNKSWEAFVES